VFSKIFSPENTDHLKIDCRINDKSILKKYKENQSVFEMIMFAEELRKAELKGDGTRNKQITEGNLFIKKESNRLILLKLENIEVIDKEKNYEMRTSFSTESNYYKGCILGNDLNKITIIDKNKSVAKYWREGFLNLSLNRNEYQNSKELIEMLKEDKLFTETLMSQDNFQEIKDQTENYIFSNDSFDKVNLAELLRVKHLIEEKELNKIYSDESKKIDTEFSISKQAVKEDYNKTIYISPETKIYTENYVKLIKRQGIEYQDGKIILSVDEDFISKLPNELQDEN
ncbi:hypothetical protein IIH89_002182, partial [Listeria monocytogenes]|nr:hypothetical protein [Listeria monocytogenes]